MSRLKKSEIYHEAMRAVIRAGIHSETEIIQIMEVLMDGKRSAQWLEESTAKREGQA